MKNSQIGRSMIEMIGVLAVIGVLSVGGLAGYTKAMMQYRANRTMEQIMEIASRISLIGEQTSSYEGLSNNVAIKMKAVPGDMITAGSTDLEGMFEGDVTIGASNLLSGTSDSDDNSKNLAFTITYTGLSSADCLRMAAQEWKSGNNGSLIGVGFAAQESVKSTVADNLYLGCTTNAVSSGTSSYVLGCADGLPLTADKAMAGCNCSGNTCIMVVKYY